ncbi:MAG: HAD-superfamily hydrolase, subfamily variant 3 [Flavipsychrobacter sp.]|nr:HAD-superfamily hydrolase, subfamily variant 3 [Flavipsychrobacter sp.]
MIKGIRHIIFDLGGVLINIDYKLTEQAFIDVGITNFAELYSQMQQSAIFDKFEMGQITREEFISSMMKMSPTPLTEAQVLKAWNAMLLDFPVRRLQILQQLRLYYDLFLLSNTNELHEESFNNILMQAHGMPNIGVFFDKVYFSHRVGMRKPMKEIFQRVLDDNGLKPEHTLFIDDSLQHIEAAKALGIQTIYLEKGMTIEDNVFKNQAPNP